jgi:outer membrane protein TolC
MRLKVHHLLLHIVVFLTWGAVHQAAAQAVESPNASPNPNPDQNPQPTSGSVPVAPSPQPPSSPAPEPTLLIPLTESVLPTFSAPQALAPQPAAPQPLVSSQPLASPQPQGVAKPRSTLLFAGRGGRSVWVSQTPAPTTVAAPPTTNFNPDPDPLRVPTQTNQLQINLNQPISLDQAQELALRNSRLLQVSELQLQQQRAGLRQVQSSLFPTVALQSEFNRSLRGGSLVPPSRPRVQTQLQQQQVSQGQQQLQQQQQQEQQALTRDLGNLQQRFQGSQISSTSDDRNLELTQQLQQLEQNSAAAANNTPQTFTPPAPLISPTLNLSGGGGGSDTSNEFNHTLSVNYTVFTGGNRSANLSGAKEQVRSAMMEVQRQADQLRLDVSLDYYNAQQADAQVGIAQSTVTNARISLRDTEARERAGIGTRFDVLQAQVALANALQNLNQANNLQRVSRRQLVQRLSLNDTVEISPAESIAPAGQWNLELPQSIILAFKNRVELQQQLSQRQIAIQSRRAALSELAPQIGFFANVNTQDALFDQVTPRFGYSLGVQMRIRAFDGGAARASAAEQTANISQIEAQFAERKDEIRLQVEQAFFSLRSNQQSLETSRLSVDQANEGLRLARLRFQAGVGTQADVTSAEADLTRARGNFLAATLDYNRALANLRRAVGYADSKPAQ